MKQIIVLLLILGNYRCTMSQKNAENINLFDQYACLLERSFAFVEKGMNKSIFLESLNEYLSRTAEYNFNDGRLEYIICHPILLNAKEDKSVILVLKRSLDNGKRVERIKFVSGRLENQHWEFKVKTGYTQSFSYEGEYSSISDQEITLRVLRNLATEGFLKDSPCGFEDSFFKSDWYAF